MSKSIVKACVRYNDRLYTGFDHGECFKKLNEDNMIIVHSYIEQGFVDSDGNFVDRKQSMIIAKEAGQLRYEPSKKTLISEDLHLDWLNQQDHRIAELEEQLKNAIVPKFKVGQMVYSPLDLQDIYKGQIDVFDYYAQKYWVFFGDDIGCEWCCESELFKTKKEAQAKLKELQGE